MQRLEDTNWAVFRLGAPRRRVLRWAQAGKIPSVRIGRKTYFDPQQIEDFIARGGRGLNQAPSSDSRKVTGS